MLGGGLQPKETKPLTAAVPDFGNGKINLGLSQSRREDGHNVKVGKER